MNPSPGDQKLLSSLDLYSQVQEGPELQFLPRQKQPILRVTEDQGNMEDISMCYPEHLTRAAIVLPVLVSALPPVYLFTICKRG